MRCYDNERLGKEFKKRYRFRRQRRAAQGYRYSTEESTINFLKFFKHQRLRQDVIEFTEDSGDESHL